MPGQLTAWRSILFQTISLAMPSITHIPNRPPLLSPFSSPPLCLNAVTPSTTSTGPRRCGTLTVIEFIISVYQMIPLLMVVERWQTGDTAPQSVLDEKKKSNLQFAPEVRPSGQVQTSISKISFRAPAIHLPTPPSACWTASLVTKLFWSWNRQDTWQIFRSSKCAAVKGRPQRDGVRWWKLVSLHETGLALFFLVKILISPNVVWSKPC